MTAAGLEVRLGPERARALLDAAVAAATADEIEVAVATRTASVLRFAGRRVHQPQDLATVQFAVRAVVGGRAARVATTSPALLDRAVHQACVTAGALASSSGAGGAAPHPPADPASAGADRAAPPWSASTAAWGAPERAAQIAAWHRAAGATELAGTLTAAAVELAVATGRGVRRYGAATEASLSLTATCADGSSHAEELGRDAGELDADRVAAATTAEARRMQAPAPLPAGVYDVVFGPLAAAELISFLPAFGFDAPALAAGIGAVARAERLLSPLVTVVDDATGGPGLPFPFDVEGVTKQRVVLVDAGRPAGVVSDLAHAAVTGGSTGHAHVARESAPAPCAANLRLEAGRASLDDLVAGVDDGVYVQRLWYTRVVDAAAGVITGTTRDAAFRIRGGRLGPPVAGVPFTESVLDALTRVDGVGSRVGTHGLLNVWNGSVGAPALRVRGFRLGLPT